MLRLNEINYERHKREILDTTKKEIELSMNNPDISRSERNFYQYFIRTFLPRRIDEIAKKTALKERINIFSIVIGLLSFFVFVFSIFAFHNVYLLLPLLIVAIVFYTNKDVREYLFSRNRNEFDDEISNELIETVFSDLEFTHPGKLKHKSQLYEELSIKENFSLVNNKNRTIRTTEALRPFKIEGLHNGSPITMRNSVLSLREKERSRTLLSGLQVTFELPRGWEDFELLILPKNKNRFFTPADHNNLGPVRINDFYLEEHYNLFTNDELRFNKFFQPRIVYDFINVFRTRNNSLSKRAELFLNPHLNRKKKTVPGKMAFFLSKIAQNSIKKNVEVILSISNGKLNIFYNSGKVRMFNISERGFGPTTIWDDIETIAFLLNLIDSLELKRIR